MWIYFSILVIVALSFFLKSEGHDDEKPAETQPKKKPIEGQVTMTEEEKPVDEKPVEKQPEKKRKSRRKLYGIIAAVFVVLIIIGIAIPGESTTSPTPTPTKPAITASEQAYAASVADQSGTLSEVFYELGGLMSNPQIGNDDWSWNVVIQLAIIQAAYDEAMDLDPPNSMAAIHLKYIQGMDNLNDFTNLMAQGLDELDASLIDAANQKMEAGNYLLNEATQLTLDFLEAHK